MHASMHANTHTRTGIHTGAHKICLLKSDISNSLFVPCLQCIRVVWEVTFASYADYIARIEKEAIKIISHQSYRSHFLPIFKEPRLLLFSNIFYLKLLTFAL